MVDASYFKNAEDFDAWLQRHGKSKTEIWLRLAKKSAAEQTLNYAQALDIALCHGWIDGVKRGLNDEYFLQRFTPRKASSAWSTINCEKAELLQKDGRMQPAGLAAVNQAKANGMWDKAYAGSASIEVPEDFATALRMNAKAGAFFSALDRQNRYAVLYRIGAVKKPETRARKIAQYVEMLGKGEKLYP